MREQAELPPISFSHILRSNDMRDELISEVVQRIQEPDIVTAPFDAELSFSADEEQEVIRLKNDNKWDDFNIEKGG